MPCPRRLLTLDLVSLHFFSDYGLIKNEEEKWTNTGKRYRVPEWIAREDSGSPIVHRMDKAVKLELTFKGGPPGACTESGTITGTGPDGLTFSERVAFKPGKQTFALQSAENTSREVKALQMTIAWSAKAPLASYSGTTSNETYQVMDRPIEEGYQEDGVTQKRASTAVEWVSESGSLDPHEIVDWLMKKFSFYTLQTDPAVPIEHKHPGYNKNRTGGAWPMADFADQSGECQAIVRFVRGIIRQVGCPSDARTYVVWADPDVDNGKTVLEGEWGMPTLHLRKKMVDGLQWHAALADRELPSRHEGHARPDPRGIRHPWPWSRRHRVASLPHHEDSRTGAGDAAGGRHRRRGAAGEAARRGGVAVPVCDCLDRRRPLHDQPLLRAVGHHGLARPRRRRHPPRAPLFPAVQENTGPAGLSGFAPLVRRGVSGSPINGSRTGLRAQSMRG